MVHIKTHYSFSTVLYKPNKEVPVDEAVVNFQGQLATKQNNTNETHHKGIKLCARQYTFAVYDRKEGNKRENGYGIEVVKLLTKDLHGLGHIVFHNNYFTSVELMESLLEEVKRGGWQALCMHLPKYALTYTNIQYICRQG